MNIPFQGSMLVRGAVGKGKTTLLRAMIREGFEGEVSVISSKDGVHEFRRAVDAGLVHHITPFHQARKEIERVYDIFCARKDRSLSEGETTTQKAIFVLIDEANGILFPVDWFPAKAKMPEDTITHLKELITLGPTVGIQVVVAGYVFDEKFARLFGVTVDLDRHVIQYRTIAAIA